ncbi:NAD-dependent epimerase/dehydratase family protein [Rhodococcus sp. BL-253-APC-6A1W]|uniref:NAD-dependent epimerase/dehydratase family protein n=1 Tax=Rhodococcus sp. BL-253-APC-6A1W TaxID=2725307 RepID=UPI00146A2247|nr:NAD-dependent epimerase/dehydratase family protein [Rhodococcus sp. BL-253-APC-6A1W]NMD97028.1 NAD-dependent epimerase/dehydratase family protein [Rhodococcus sp. BL-253-APC-6A1W]
MRVLVLGGTTFIGRRIVERLHERGDRVLVVHRGHHEPSPWVAVDHLRVDRLALGDHADDVRRFDPDAVVDTYALTADHVDAVLPAIPEVPTVVLSSVDVYQAFTGLTSGRCESAVPLTEDSEVRRERYPYRGARRPGIPDAYDKLDVEERWLPRGAVVLRLPMVYGPHDPQRREDPVLRRIRAGRQHIPVGAGNLLWTRVHVDDVATGVLAALDTRAADGMAVNLGEPATVPVIAWVEQIIAAAGSALEPVRVPESVLPGELALMGGPAQHVLVSVSRAENLLGWSPGDPQQREAESVRWHLDNPPASTWSAEDSRVDEDALGSV